MEAVVTISANGNEWKASHNAVNGQARIPRLLL